MVDLHEASNPERNEIDTLGWLFVAFVVVVTAVAVMAAFNANDTMVTNTAVSHVAPPS
jgi:uncharacterized YccA/Bax inhibitor family protein